MFTFGILGNIDSTAATVIFVITILFLTGFEFLTEGLEYVVRDNPIYNQMLQRIYKELMIMGFITFVIAMYLASDNSGIFSQYITEIDFIGYITFFVALFFVAHAMYIMILSMHTTKVYARLHSTTVADLIGDYTKQLEKKCANFLFEVPILPVSSLRQAVEFKIIHALFRDTFWLPSDFDYGSYLARSFEKYSLRMINIGLSSWVIMIVLCGVNFLRIKLSPSIDTLSCEKYELHSNSTLERRLVEVLSHDCSHLHLNMFMVCGAFIALYAFVIYLIGRYYLQKLVNRAGVTNTSDYYKFLMLDESVTLMQSATRNIEVKVRRGSKSSGSKRGRRMSTNTLRSNVNSLLKDKSTEKEGGTGQIFKTISERSRSSGSLVGKAMLNLRRTLSLDASVKPQPGGDRGTTTGAYPRDGGGQGQSKKSILYGVPAVSKRQTIINKVNNIVKPSPSHPPRRRNMVIKLSKGHSKENLNDLEEVESLTSIEQFKLMKIKEMRRQKIERASSNKNLMISYLRDKNKVAVTSGKEDMKLSEDFSDIYFFRSPQLYFKMVEVAIMLNSLYLSLWATNFITVVNDHFNRSAFLHAVMLVPLLVVLPSLGEIVKVSSLLDAVADLDLDVIGSVLEVAEEKSQLVNEVRGKILTRIHGKRDKDKIIILKQLFEEIDQDGSGEISKYELRDMLRALQLHYSDYKFRRLYEAIDQDGSGEMDMEEFIDLVFPRLAQKRDVQRRTDLLKQHSDAYEDPSGSRSRIGHSRHPEGAAQLSGFQSTINRFKTEIQKGRERSQSTESAKGSSDDGAGGEEQNSIMGSGTEEVKSGGSDEHQDSPVRNMRYSQLMRNHDMIIDEESSVGNYSVDTATTPVQLHKTEHPVAFCSARLHDCVAEDDDSEDIEQGIEGGVSELSRGGPGDSAEIVPEPEGEHEAVLSSQTGGGEGDLAFAAFMERASVSSPGGSGSDRGSGSGSDEISEVSALFDSVCRMDHQGGADHVHEADPPYSWPNDLNSMTGSYYSVYDSDDNSLMTSTLRDNQMASPNKSQPPEQRGMHREPSIEVMMLLSSEENKNKNTGARRRKSGDLDSDNMSTFTLNPRAATALQHISSQHLGNSPPL